ncbi:putative tricarboxylic transport membrane protein [Paracoccus halophilus]|uniref:Membrane protein n=1 Tax=Paracoccus halophilus TaxID=376733 RepID=A0A099EZD1_9RHOB|nr:tripartite tricarboxylate transporter TctB family protein [Paracoccus halophilus]KGJ03544.1 membrane protein [Paracoccus halophilus]SFA57804.1 putative tricarboxylic transport membrane protein [Paracoccus halophilus]
MADRIFAGVLLLVTLAYAFIAFTAIQAPFQYDPLGPESWPRLLSVVAIGCILGILWRPDNDSLDVARTTWFRLAAILVLLVAYAELFEPLGFIISTFLFSAVVSAMLGARPARALLFGAAAGLLGYVVCVMLLDLNLPGGFLGELEWGVSAPETQTEPSTGGTN